MSAETNGAADLPINALFVHGAGGPLRTLPADSSEGLICETATSGLVALRMLMQHRYDVLVADPKLPDVDVPTLISEAINIAPWLEVVVADPPAAMPLDFGPAELARRAHAWDSRNCQPLASLIRSAGRDSQLLDYESSNVNGVSFLRDHLRMVTDFYNDTTRHAVLPETMAKFARGIRDVMPCDAIGILLDDEGSPAVHIAAQTPVSQKFVDDLKKCMFDRYALLTKSAVNTVDAGVTHSGVPLDDAGPATQGTTVPIPVVVGDEVGSIVAIASTAKEAYRPHDVSLLYHAVNHLALTYVEMRRIQRLASHDPLTGVCNRVRLGSEFEHAWELSRRYDYSMGIVILDIDGFKPLNDTYGHNVGDQILIDFTARINEVVRDTDIVGRYGGDEFVVVLPRATDADARQLGERLMALIADRAFCGDSHRLNLAISIGVATSKNPAAPATSKELLCQADRALYRAKRNGGDGMCIWPEKPELRPTVGVSPVAQRRAALPPAGQDRLQVRGAVVVVDDQLMVVNVVKAILERGGHRVVSHCNADEALADIRQHAGEYDILLTDLELPGMGGHELMTKVGEVDESIVKIVMTGYATVDNAVASLREGAYDFIQKPIVMAHLHALINRALEYRALRLQQQTYRNHLEDLVRERSAQLAASLEAVRESCDFTLEALVAMLDARERKSGAHSRRVQELAVTLARKLRIGGGALDSIASGALLHDIGLIGMPDSLLLKEGSLDEEEWEVMHEHPMIGYKILKSSPYLQEAAKIVRDHHERFDGTGYPRGIAGEDICLGARVFAVVDAYDAMRSGRVYREAMSVEDAVAELRANAGTQFDPSVVGAFVDHQPEIEGIYQRHHSGDRSGSAEKAESVTATS